MTSKIKGYRDLNQTEIDLMNRVKAKGEELDDLCADIGRYLIELGENCDDDRIQELLKSNPRMWLQMGAYDLQCGLMKLVRSVAQPSNF